MIYVEFLLCSFIFVLIIEDENIGYNVKCPRMINEIFIHRFHYSKFILNFSLIHLKETFFLTDLSRGEKVK